MKPRAAASILAAAAIIAGSLIPSSAQAWGGYENGRIPASQLSPYGSELLKSDAAAALNNLNTAFTAAFGYGFTINDGYRSYDDQVYWRNYWCSQGACNLAAVPGTSNHGWGLAIDVAGVGRTDWSNAKYR